MKVGDIVKFKRGRSHYERRGYEVGDGTIPTQTYPAHMRGKLAIITKMSEGYGEAATEVCMITHDPYGNGDKIIPLPNRPNCEYGFIEGDDLEVISSGADQ